jgi:DNA modification methylase
MAKRIELWPLDRLVPYARNPRTHSDAQVAQIAASIAQFGFNNPVLVDTSAGIIAGHGRLLAARKLELDHIPVIMLDHLDDTQKRAYLLADNKLAELAGWDENLLRAELEDLKAEDFDLDVLGFSADDLRLLLEEEADGTEDVGDERPTQPPVEPVTRPGDLWLIRNHRLICGDCRDACAVARLFDGDQANLVITSPPYATQREYDAASGFQAVLPELYVGWFGAVAAGIDSVLAPDGSYFLNIKEHAENGERTLYVHDLVLAHKRLWGWRFVDEFCWRKTDNGVPGRWSNRFKNAWEPVFHFCRQMDIKFRPKAVGHVSEDCFDYSPNNPDSASGSGLLGAGARGAAADHAGADSNAGRFTGIAWPSNVIEVKSESGQGSHSAPFPRALAEFFVKAFSDAGDIIFDPFVGSGTTIAAAHVQKRAGYGIEISPAYCDVVLRRIQELTGEKPTLAGTWQPLPEVAAERGVPADPTREACDE